MICILNNMVKPIPDRVTLNGLVEKWLNGNHTDPDFDANEYGPINEWDISNVDDLSYLFHEKNTFNEDIGGWDTSNVTDMYAMFYNASAFNQNIGSWNTSQVTDMSFMFYRCHAFNQNISTKEVTVNGLTYTAWDTSKVTNMKSMFYMDEYYFDNGHKFLNSSKWNNGQLSGEHTVPLYWDTSNVTNMSYMFKECRHFNQNVSTKKVTIGGSTYISFDTKNVDNMSYILSHCDSFNNGDERFESNNPLNWNTDKCLNLRYTFGNLYPMLDTNNP